MGKICKILKTVIMMTLVAVLAIQPVSATDEWSPEGELTNSFYIPKSRFMSSYDYAEYCQKMYLQGYMDEDYEWTSAARNYINNMTVDNYNKLDQDARAIVQRRIERGEMKKSESPYLTAEERDIALMEEAGLITPVPTEEPEESEMITAAPKGDVGSMEPVEATPEPEPEPETNSPVSTVIMIVVMLIAAGGAFIIYKRQKQ